MSSPRYHRKRSRFFQRIDKEALKKDKTAHRYEQWMKRYIRNLLGRKDAKDDGMFSLVWETKKPWALSKTFVEVSAVIHRCTPSSWVVEIAREPEDEYQGWLFVKK